MEGLNLLFPGLLLGLKCPSYRFAMVEKTAGNGREDSRALGKI